MCQIQSAFDVIDLKTEFHIFVGKVNNINVIDKLQLFPKIIIFLI